jgi:metallo-beta-lactamase class B
MRTTLRVTGFVAASVLAALIAQGDWTPQVFAQTAKKEELSESYRGSQKNNVAYQKVAPIKVFDNLHYVGPGFVSVWLISTPEGAILIDGAEEPYVDHVIDSVRKQGFQLSDIKYIVLSHGHLDHFGGVARIQQLSGARVVALEEDWALMEQAATRPGRNNSAPPAVPKRDMVVKEGDTLTLGGQTIKFYRHPGHTAGSLSAEFTVFDSGRPHKAFMFGGPGPRGGVAGATQFLESSKRIAEIPNVEVHVQVHSWLASYPYPNGGIFERAQKLAQRKQGEPHPFADAASWRQWVGIVQKGAADYLAEQKQKGAP